MQSVENQEQKLIKNKYRLILKSCPKTTTKEDKKEIRKAFNFALEAHKDMKRKSGEAYVLHPIEVAIITLREIGLGATSVICALLHDVVEDTDYTIDDIKSLFGEKVAKIVYGLTKISGIFKNPDANQSIQAENFRKVLLTLSDDMRVILIKLADRLHNMRTLDSLPKHKQLRIASETSYFYAPLAHRLGFYSIKSEMEDIVLKHINPEIYNSISRKLADSEIQRKRFINSFTLPIKQSLTRNGLNYQIYGRLKSMSSIWNKMQKKQVAFEEVYDIFAVRIIIQADVEHEHLECMKAAGIVEGLYRRNPERYRNWLSMPKSNGYEALHTTVMSKEGKWVEVQIRSQRMDDIAEKGFAAHWKYKNIYTNIEYESNIDKWLNKIRDSIQNSKSDALNFIQDFKNDYLSDEIFIFTPRGDMKQISSSFTALDFAYSIHTKVGDQAIGAKINHKLAPLDSTLKNGDQVEIITSENQKPRKEWLDFAVSSRAISHIEISLRNQRKEYLEEGKEVLKNMFEQLGYVFSDSLIDKLRHHLQYDSRDDLLIDAAQNKILISSLKVALRDRLNWKEFITFIPKFISSLYESSEADPEIIEQSKDFELGNNNSFEKSMKNIVPANCCNPIQGDDIIGFKQYNEIVIHRPNCKNAIRMSSTFGHKIVKIEWKDTNIFSFQTIIKIEGTDKIGIIRDVSRILSEEMNINIKSFHLESKKDIFEGRITVFITDTVSLKNLIKKIKKIEGVKKVSRVFQTDENIQ